MARFSAQGPSPDVSHEGGGRDAALRRPRAVQARNWRFAERRIRGLGHEVPPLNAAGTAQRAIPTFASLLLGDRVIKYAGDNRIVQYRSTLGSVPQSGRWRGISALKSPRLGQSRRWSRSTSATTTVPHFSAFTIGLPSWS